MTDTQEFISKYGPLIQEATQGTGIFPSVNIAQMIEETGWGKTIHEAGNNCYGIKAYSNWTGKVVSDSTNERINGVYVHFTGTGLIYDNYQAAIQSGADHVTLFRTYDSPEASIQDHLQLLLSDHYAAVRNTETPEDQARAIEACHYATGADYANKLIAIINDFHLTSLDE